MKKKLLSLVLAAMMTIGCFAGLGAAVGQDTDFAALSVEDQYAAIMAAGSEADAQALFDTLDAEQQAALTAYADRQQENTDTSKETDPIPAVNYTNVAPLVTVNKVSQPAKARLMSARSTARPIEKGKTADGLILNKTATPVEGSADDYKITLEAYTTGTVSTSETTKPTDIVLVLDQSGSMADCMVCGNEIEQNSTHRTYIATNSVSNSGKYTYYIKNGSDYTRVYYCDGDHGWRGKCNGGAGWYTSESRRSHTSNNKITPKTSNNPNGTQFYEQKEEDCTSRLAALNAAVTSFTNAVAEKAKGPDGILGTDDDVNHRIAVVGFASESGYGNNTELLSISGSNSGTVGIAYKSITSQNLKDVLQDMDKQAGQTMVTNAINALAAQGATRTDLGMDMANRILNANPLGANEQRNRVVVVFTDGSPTDSNGFENNVANNAINKAKTIKDGNTTVYSIGIFSGADATQTGTKPTYDFSMDGWGNTNYTDSQMSEACNWFMQNLSSNNGTVQDPSYYLSASDADTLSTIFQKISNQISESNINLGSDTQIKDVVSKYFDMPKNTSAVSVKSYDCTGFSDGEPTWSKTSTVLNNAVTLDTENNTVNVTGFDFNANYVTVNGRSETDPKQPGNFHGRKLVIEFTVTAKDGFVGGNSVPTNGSDSGVYDKDGKEVATFDVPQVNVPIKSELTVNDNVIYEGGSADVSGLYNAADTSSWEYDFVDVSYTVEGADGDTVSPADCTDYLVKATFSPKYDGQNASGTINGDVTKDGSATIHVLKPTVTVNAIDVWKHYGESYNAPDGSRITGSVAWSDKNGHDVRGIAVIGSEPYGTDDLQYSYENGSFVVPNTDTTINVVVSAKGKELTSTSYVVHPKFCTLTVKKDVANLYGANDSFIFNVVGEGNIKYEAKVVINGAGSATLTGLPVGSYTVTEDTGWSWRYKSDNSKATTTLSSAKDNDSVTITNKLDDNRWLGDETFVINKCEKSNEKSKITKVYESVMSFFGIV